MFYKVFTMSNKPPVKSQPIIKKYKRVNEIQRYHIIIDRIVKLNILKKNVNIVHKRKRKTAVVLVIKASLSTAHSRLRADLASCANLRISLKPLLIGTLSGDLDLKKSQQGRAGAFSASALVGYRHMTLQDGNHVIQPPQQVQLYIRTRLTDMFVLNRIQGFCPEALKSLKRKPRAGGCYRHSGFSFCASYIFLKTFCEIFVSIEEIRFFVFLFGLHLTTGKRLGFFVAYFYLKKKEIIIVLL